MPNDVRAGLDGLHEEHDKGLDCIIGANTVLPSALPLRRVPDYAPTRAPLSRGSLFLPLGR